MGLSGGPGSRQRVAINQSTTMSARVKRLLRQYDLNDDDWLDVNEVTALVETLLAEEARNTWLKWAVIGLVTFAVLLLAAIVGLAFAVGEALKDTRIDGNVMTVKGSSDAVQVASMDYLVVNGLPACMDTIYHGLETTPEAVAIFTVDRRLEAYACVRGEPPTGHWRWDWAASGARSVIGRGEDEEYLRP